MRLQGFHWSHPSRYPLVSRVYRSPCLRSPPVAGGYLLPFHSALVDISSSVSLGFELAGTSHVVAGSLSL